MSQAYVVRPYPHGRYRVKEFLGRNIVAIGWPGVGDLSSASNRGDIKKALASQYSKRSARSLGQAAGTIFRFIIEMKNDACVLVPDGDLVYIGRIDGGYHYDLDSDSPDEGYPHQRPVHWLHEKRAIKRNLLTGRIYDSLKGRQTVFSTYFEDVDKIVRKGRNYFSHQSNIDLKHEYTSRLQQGLLRNVNSNTFENAVCALFAVFFPGLRRLSTTNSDVGDTDLLAELPGDVNVRIQVKHFYPDRGLIEPWVVDQLSESMEPGDNGIIVTTGAISEAARQAADGLSDRTVTFIDGVEFVEYLFEAITNMPDEALTTFGLNRRVGFL